MGLTAPFSLGGSMRVAGDNDSCNFRHEIDIRMFDWKISIIKYGVPGIFVGKNGGTHKL
jgi:hypothetical protein